MGNQPGCTCACLHVCVGVSPHRWGAGLCEDVCSWGPGKVDARWPPRARGGRRARPTAHVEASNADSRALSVAQECRTSARPSLEVTTDSLRTTSRRSEALRVKALTQQHSLPQPSKIPCRKLSPTCCLNKFASYHFLLNIQWSKSLIENIQSKPCSPPDPAQ